MFSRLCWWWCEKRRKAINEEYFDQLRAVGMSVLPTAHCSVIVIYFSCGSSNSVQRHLLNQNATSFQPFPPYGTWTIGPSTPSIRSYLLSRLACIGENPSTEATQYCNRFRNSISMSYHKPSGDEAVYQVRRKSSEWITVIDVRIWNAQNGHETQRKRWRSVKE